MHAYEIRVTRLPRWATPLVFAVALAAMALAFIVGLGLFLIAVPVALIAALVGRIASRHQREVPSERQRYTRGQTHVIEGEYTVVEDKNR